MYKNDIHKDAIYDTFKLILLTVTMALQAQHDHLFLPVRFANELHFASRAMSVVEYTNAH